MSVAAIAATLFRGPPGVFAHPGDLVLSKPGGGPAVGAFATPGDPQAALGRERAAAAVAAARPGAAPGVAAPPASRRTFPHYLTRPGSRSAPIISSRAKSARGHVDVTTRARDLAAARAAAGPSGHRRDALTSEPGQDLVRIAIIRVDFRSDRSGGSSSGDGRFDLAPRDTVNRPLDPTPHNKAFWQSHGDALARYWDAQTNGRTVIETVTYPSESDSAFHLSDMADYGPWKFSPEIYEAAVKLFHDCINAADTTETIPWSTFDRVMIVHAGSDLQSDVFQDSPLDIPTFTIGVPDSDAVVVGPAKADTIFGAVIAPETIRQDGYEGVVNAVIAHEAGHLIYGFRDVYDVVSGLPVVGYWSLMDVGNLLGNAVTFPSGLAVYATGLLPPSVDPWQKRLIYPDVPLARFPNWGQEETLGNSSEAFEVIQVPLSGEEYLLLENRLDDLNGNGVLTLQRDPATGVILGPAPEDAREYDYLVPGPGILAWQVDESVADYFGPRADPGFGLNVNPARNGLEIVEADGLDDLGDFNSPFALGVPSDTWKAGPASRLNDDTVPSLRTHSRTNPHLDLEFTSAPGPDMTLRVSRQWDLPGWPVRVTQPPEGISPIVGIFGDDPNPRIAWTGGDSAVHVRNLDGTIPAGWPSDVALAPGYPLGPVALVPHPGGGNLLAVARSKSVGPGGVLLTVECNAAARIVTTVAFPAAITAGPIASESAPDRVIFGLAEGSVCEYRTDTGAVHDLFPVGPGAVTGLALDGLRVAATGVSGKLGFGTFAGTDASAAFTSFLAAADLPTGHDIQPILLSRGAAGQQVVVVDRTAGSARTFAFDAAASPLDVPWQGRELGEAVGPPAVADLDLDGEPEVAFLTASGRVGYWNLNGSTSPGWPPDLEREGFPSSSGPLPFTSTTLSPDPLLLAPLGNGVVVALDRSAKNVEGFPLGFSVGTRGTPALWLGASSPWLFAAGGDTLLYGIGLGGAVPVIPAGPTIGSNWTAMGGGSTRSYADGVTYVPNGGGSATSAIVEGSLVCYPNPARREPITFAFRLEAAGPVTLSVYDAAARLVQRIDRDGTVSDNAITWDPAGVASGLYVARIEAGGTVVTKPFALLR